MLEFACSICLGVYIAYLVELEASFKSYRIIDSSSYKEDIVSVRILCCKPLDPFLVEKDVADLVGDGLHLFYKMRVLLVIDLSFTLANSIARQYIAMSCAEYALVVATLISGPAIV